MKSRKLSSLIALAAFALVFIHANLAAQDDAVNAKKPKHHHYKLVDMGTFGGPASYFPETIAFINAKGDLNSRGLAAGGSSTSTSTTGTSNTGICGGLSGLVPFVYHAFDWQNGTVRDLGSLGGADYCSVSGGINAKGEIVGGSENGEIDPFTGFNKSRAVLWEAGSIQDLGTLGGYEGTAAGINDRGQVVGIATNAIPDPIACFGLGAQCRAFLWQDGVMQDLGTLGGPDAFAILINEHGQVAGSSYTNSVPVTDPFLWEKGKGMQDLGTLGGTTGFPLALNNRGQVVGFSNVAGDLTGHPFLWPGKDGTMMDLGTLGGNYGIANAINESGEVVGYSGISVNQPELEFAFLWRNGAITNLGSLGSDPCSTANAINSRGQVVGISATCDYLTFRRAFLWENGSMVDLNTLISPGSGMQLTLAETINDRGEIAVNGTPSGCGVVEDCGHAVLLIPCDDDHPGVEGCDYSMVEAAEVSGATLATRAPQSTQLSKDAIGRMMSASRNPFLRRWRMPVQRPFTRN